MAKAMYAFSGDPITYGHINIIERAAKAFDEVIVGIGVNPNKKYTFTLEERTAMAKQAVAGLKNVEVVSFTGLLVSYAYEKGIHVLVKGVRDSKDFDYEMLLHQAGESQKLGIDTHLLPARQDLIHVASSVVKSILIEQGDVHTYVPIHVQQTLYAKMLGQYPVAITGEPGVGKSYIGRLFAAWGKAHNICVHNIDLDYIAYQILGELTDPVYRKIRAKVAQEFGEAVVAEDGCIDRKALGEIVFNEANALNRLNAIMEIPISVRLKREMHHKRGIIVINSALIAESDMLHLCNNNVILVTTSREIQKMRLRSKGFTDRQIERRLNNRYYTADDKKRLIQRKIKEQHHGTIWTVDNSLAIDEALFGEVVQKLDYSQAIQ